MDAVIATALAHLAFVVHLRLTDSSSMTAEWLQAWREPWWWGIYFAPGLIILLFISLRSRPRHVLPLAIGTFALYVAIVALTPRVAGC